MLKLNEIVALKGKLKNDKISVKNALNIYWKTHKKINRSWNTKDWKQRKNSFLKNNCEICESSDGLIVQHNSHPLKYSDYLRELKKYLTSEYINIQPELDTVDFQNYVLSNFKYEPVLLCPNCKNKNPSTRKIKKPKYRCADCKYEFEEATFRSETELLSIFLKDEYAYEVIDRCFISKDQWKNKHKLSYLKYLYSREKVFSNDEELIKKTAMIFWLDDVIKYLSFEDAITACRKCAYNEDILKKDLCPICKENYKEIQYPTCLVCLPAEKRWF